MTKVNTKKYDKYFDRWGSGAYKSGYKSPIKTSYSNSSFWMDDDFLTSEDTDVKKVDYIKLAGYKRAISNFVRIVTGKDNIPVNYSSGKDSYTDGKQVVISSKLDEKEFDSTVGLALHEGSHIALTDFKTAKNRLNTSSADVQKLHEKYLSIPSYDIHSRLWTLTNVIEDRRIDNYIFKSAPGYQGYYEALYNTYFRSKDIDQALKQNLKTDVTWESYEFHIINFANPNRQLDALPGLRAVWNLISLPTIGRLASTSEVIDLAIEVFDEIHKHLPVGSASSTSQNQQQQNQQGSAETPEDVNDISVGEGENNSQGGMDPNLDLPPMSGESTNESSNSDNATPGSGGSIKTDTQRKAEEKLNKAIDKALKKQKDFLNGDIKKKNLSKGDADRINSIADSNLSYAEVGGTVYDVDGKKLDGGLGKCLVVKGMTNSLIESRLLDDHCYSTDSLNRMLESFKRNPDRDYIASGIALGTLLGKRLKTRDEDRSLKNSRLETGRIDRRLVAELGFGNDRVFSQVLHRTVTPSLIHISLDASGSMAGGRWERAMKTAVAIAKAGSMISSLDVVISLRGTYSSAGCPLMWIVYDSRKDSFNAIKNKLYLLHATGSTPEGLCYEAVMKEIISSATGKEAFFINLCDGEPGWSGRDSIGYYGEYAIEHTRTQVNKMKAAGIKTLGYFISDSLEGDYIKKSLAKFKRMYGTNSEAIDVENLSQLSRSLNKMLERQDA